MKPGDWLVLVLSTLLIGALYGHFWSAAPAAVAAVVHSDHSARQVVDLASDATLRVDGPLGETEVEISGGRARIAASPCSDKFCVHYGWLDHAGEVIACVPNRVVMQLAGADQRYDAINF